MHTVAISTIEFGITFTGDTGDVKDFHTFNANRGRRQMILGLPGYKSNVTNKQKTYWYLDDGPLFMFVFIRESAVRVKSCWLHTPRFQGFR